MRPSIAAAEAPPTSRYHGAEGVNFVLGNSVLFRDFCIAGTFGAPGHASGTVALYQGAYAHRPARPYETHHWTASVG